MTLFLGYAFWASSLPQLFGKSAFGTPPFFDTLFFRYAFWASYLPRTLGNKCLVFGVCFFGRPLTSLPAIAGKEHLEHHPVLIRFLICVFFLAGGGGYAC